MRKDMDTSLNTVNTVNADQLLLAAGFKKPPCSPDLFCGICRRTIYSESNRLETIYVNEDSLRFEFLCSKCGQKYSKPQ